MDKAKTMKTFNVVKSGSNELIASIRGDGNIIVKDGYEVLPSEDVPEEKD